MRRMILPEWFRQWGLLIDGHAGLWLVPFGYVAWGVLMAVYLLFALFCFVGLFLGVGLIMLPACRLIRTIIDKAEQKKGEGK